MMKDDQGTVIINPETMRIIRNLREKGVSDKQDREYYINHMTECMRMKYGNGKSMMSLIEEHGQKWCLNHGVIGFDHIINVSSTNGRKKFVEAKQPRNNN